MEVRILHTLDGGKLGLGDQLPGTAAPVTVARVLTRMEFSGIRWNQGLGVRGIYGNLNPQEILERV